MTAQKSEASKYQRMFWKSAARQLPHHSLILLSAKFRTQAVTTALGKRRQKQLSTSVLKQYPDAIVKKYTQCADSAKLWHGTGRLKYAAEGIDDIFKAILESGSLNPAEDAGAMLLGGDIMVTISATPLRMIARSYADIHGLGMHEKYRYGSSMWWVSYYYSMFFAELFPKHGVYMAANWSKIKRAISNDSGETAWGKKVNKNAKAIWDVFGSGSDIPGNYPVLFGISRYSLTATIPKTLAKSEIRLVNAVQLADISHIEVPEVKVNEVMTMLEHVGAAVPVYPIELGEYVASQEPFASLLGII